MKIMNVVTEIHFILAVTTLLYCLRCSAYQFKCVTVSRFSNIDLKKLLDSSGTLIFFKKIPNFALSLNILKFLRFWAAYFSYIILKCRRCSSGVISRGAQEGRAPCYNTCLFWGLSPPKTLALTWLSEFIDLASKVLWSIVHCYMVIEAFLIVDYTISVLN